MKAVVLDGHTLNPGDLTWRGLEELMECEIYDRTSPDDIVVRSADADILLTNKTALSREIIGQLPHLRYIGVLATGHNIVDAGAARERNIPVTNVPDYGTASVAQMVFAHLLNLTLHVGHHARTVRDGRWGTSDDFCYWDFPLVELQNLTLGIIGFGRIGSATARLATAFGMRVVANDRTPPASPPEGVDFLTVDEVLAKSDVVSLHCPLTPETRGLVNRRRLSLMKTTAFLINTSRGPLLDEQALADALNSGAVAGAGLDVLSAEPPGPDNPLLGARNCFITPHIAWATRSARQRLLETVVKNVRAFMEGQPQNVVN
jgi:glycerate dehydrogenase